MAVDWSAPYKAEPYNTFQSNDPHDQHGQALRAEWQGITRQIVGLEAFRSWVDEAKRQTKNPSAPWTAMPMVDMACPKNHSVARMRGALKIGAPSDPDGERPVFLELEILDIMSGERVERIVIGGDDERWLDLNPRLLPCPTCGWRPSGMRYITLGRGYLRALATRKKKIRISDPKAIPPRLG